MFNRLLANGIIIAICFQIIFFWACDPGSDSSSDSNTQTCEGCHTDKAALQEYAEVENEAPSGGG